MKIKYVGPSAEVEIAATGQSVERGGSVDVPDDIGKSLCEQDTWEADKATKRKEGDA